MRGEIYFRRSSIGRVLDLRGLQIYGSVNVAVSNREGRVSASGSRVFSGGSLNMSTTVDQAEDNDFASCEFYSLVVDEGGKVYVALSPGAQQGAVDLSQASVSGELRIFGFGENTSKKAIDTTGLNTKASGRVIVQEDLLNRLELFSNDLHGPERAALNLTRVKVGPARVATSP